MVTKEEIKRINELAKKQKAEGLTDLEKEEQQSLRQKYIQNIRKSFTNQMKSIKVIDPEGTDVTPEKIKNLRKK